MIKQIYNLAAWNWRIARRSYTVLCALFAAQQLAVLLFMAAQRQNMGQGIAGYYRNSGQALAFAAAFVAAGMLSAKSMMAGGGERTGVTWLTLPLPGWGKLAAQVLTAAVMESGILALQVVLYVAGFFPVQQVAVRVERQNLLTPMPAQLLYEQTARNLFLRCVLPAGLMQTALMAVTLAASALLLPCIFLHSGWRRAAAALVASLGGLCCLAVLYIGAFWGKSTADPQCATAVLLAIVAALMVGSWFWALQAIRSAEPAG